MGDDERLENGMKSSKLINLVKESIKSTENIIILYKDVDEMSAAVFVSENFTRDFVVIKYRDDLQFIFGRTKVAIYNRETGLDTASIDDVHEYASCIYMIRLVNDIETIETTTEKKERLIAQHVLKNISGYKIGDIMICGGYAIPIFFGQNSNAKPLADSVFLNILNGIGDFFVLGSIYLEYIKRQRKKGKRVYLTFSRDSYPNSLKISDIFFRQECSKIVFHNYLYFRHFMEPNNTVKEIITVDNWHVSVPSDKKYHAFDIIQRCLLGETSVSPYKYADCFQKNLLSHLSEEERTKIDRLISDECIGFQFYTGKCNENGRWPVVNPRCWDECSVNRFIDLCNKNGYRIVVLTPHPYQIDGDVICLGQVSMLGYIYAVSKMKYVVGIDSSAGHIAAFYNIPNLTIWKNNLGLYYRPGDENSFIGFRPIRKNISVKPIVEPWGEIDALKVYFLLEKMINGRIQYSSITDIFDESKMFHSAVYAVDGN